MNGAPSYEELTEHRKNQILNKALTDNRQTLKHLLINIISLGREGQINSCRRGTFLISKRKLEGPRAGRPTRQLEENQKLDGQRQDEEKTD